MLPTDPLTAMNLLETPESPRDSYTSEQPKQVGSGKLQHVVAFAAHSPPVSIQLSQFLLQLLSTLSPQLSQFVM